MDLQHFSLFSQVGFSRCWALRRGPTYVIYSAAARVILAEYAATAKVAGQTMEGGSTEAAARDGAPTHATEGMAGKERRQRRGRS